MCSDVASRADMFTELQQTSLQLVEAAQALPNTKHLKLGEVLCALEKATPIGLDQEGYLRHSPQQQATTDPVVLVGLQAEGAPTFRLDEWRSEALTPHRSLKKCGASIMQIVGKAETFISPHPALHSMPNQGIITAEAIPLAITLPYESHVQSRAIVLAHETTHWVDALKTRKRPLLRRGELHEDILSKALTEKRAHHIGAALYQAQEIDIESLALEAIRHLKLRNDNLITLNSICIYLANEHIPAEHVLRATPSLAAVAISKLFGTHKDGVTKYEAEVYRYTRITG